ncbi:hypothetical protein [Streptomyces inhibens]|uniref:hypothetical protein n=1 Tax=Streptomyces inhibens TaxID=2293571 RepID=UPI001EE6BE38|nr:hypothetical protein [Streptomyces inhibens]UKY47489.1 hypothetical protein KI385_00580 [Streptomyces inhibens]
MDSTTRAVIAAGFRPTTELIAHPDGITDGGDSTYAPNPLQGREGTSAQAITASSTRRW